MSQDPQTPPQPRPAAPPPPRDRLRNPPDAPAREPIRHPSHPESSYPKPPDPGAPPNDQPQKPPAPPLYKRRWFKITAILLAIALLITSILLYWYYHTYQSTDDAYTDSHVVEISAQIAGRVDRVLVDDNQDVKQGELLVVLDPRDNEAALRQAQANLQVSQAEAYRANVILSHFDQIKNQSTNAVSTQDYEQALADSRKANAQVAQQQAAVNTAQLQLSYTRITAPFDGRIARKSVEPGAYISPGQALLAVVDPHVWITANFKETQLKKMRPGDPVRIKIDAFPHLLFHGHVDSIQPGSGARFSLLPPENATGNFVKIVQRVPVKIVFDDYTPSDTLHLGVGLSVRPRVTIR